MTVMPDLLLLAYSNGLFPMAESRDAEALHWFDPSQRGIIPLDDGFHVPRRLARTLRSGRFSFTRNRAFPAVIAACAAVRPTTWINGEITALYTELHQRGFAHSVETWSGDRLAGGLYGVSLGAAFFGESMFSLETDASKAALVHLVDHLRTQGFVLLDTQMLTPHLARFGAVEISRDEYHQRLAQALKGKGQFLGSDRDQQ